jgi:hypothetical protein
MAKRTALAKQCLASEQPGESWVMKDCFYSFFFPFLTEVSSRPERTRISCHAALDKAAYAPFRKEGRMNSDDAIKSNRKSEGA